MIREVIEINEALCNGCGDCVPSCHEGALQVIDGKVRLISDLMCDGLGNCLGHCPRGALKIIQREADPYDERRVLLKNIIPAGENTIKAHIQHLRDHGQEEFLQEALDILEEKGLSLPLKEKTTAPFSCPGSKIQSFKPQGKAPKGQGSALAQWPIQLRLLQPGAPVFKKSDLLLAADCIPFALGDFHNSYLQGKSLAIACPKLDHRQEEYLEKVQTLIDQDEINTLTVMIMEVPCCRGLFEMAQRACHLAKRSIPLKKVLVSLRGQILGEEWVLA